MWTAPSDEQIMEQQRLESIKRANAIPKLDIAPPNNPLLPAATALFIIVGIYFLNPPVVLPVFPGICALCVPSKITG